MLESVAHVIGASFERAPWGWGLLALMVTAFVKLRPIMTKLAMDREATLAGRIAALETKVDAAVKAAHSAEMKLVSAVAAAQLMAAKLRAADPSDPTLMQAMELLAAATTGDFGMDRALRELAKVKGTGE